MKHPLVEESQTAIAPSSTLISVPPAPTPATPSSDWGSLIQQFNTPEGWLMIAGLVGLILLSRLVGRGQGKISTGRTTGMAEKLAATHLALRQIHTLRQLHQYNHAPQTPQGRRPKHNQVTLWCGTPRYWLHHKRLRGMVTYLQTLLGSSPTVWLPDAQRSILVLGIPGSGKTFSVIDRAVESAMQQGIPILLYDKKGDQMRLHAPLAARYGYQVHIFAPGEPFSGILNPLDFVRDPQDAVMAGELGQVINRNTNSSVGAKSDEFFSRSGDMLAKALIQLAKATACPDMAIVYAIMQLPSLVKRLDYAIGRGAIDPWIASSFSQFVSSKDAEKTVAGIQTTAALTFSSFIQADLLQSFIGSSTIPKRITGKQIIIFKLDDERRSIIGPLLAAAIHLCVVSNLATPRTDPILTVLDELPSLRLDRLVNWLNEYRSNGGCFLLGIQSLNQLYEAYGDKFGTAIAAACSTHILFNPGDIKTAEEYSKRYGDTEIKLKNRSTSRSMGQQGSYSTSWNESLQKVALLTPDQILRFPQGRCVLTSPGYTSGTEGSVPYLLKIPVPPADIRRANESETLWDTHVRSALEQQVSPLAPEDLTQALQQRLAIAEQLLPLPPEEGTPVGEHRRMGLPSVAPPAPLQTPPAAPPTVPSRPPSGMYQRLPKDIFDF